MSEYGLRSEIRVPNLILFGSNTIEELGDLSKKFGNRGVLIYGGSSLKNSGNHDRIIRILKKNALSIEEISGISHDPDNELVESITEEIQKLNPDFIIGAGGGSVIDVAKAASIIATNGGTVGDYWKGKSFLKPSIPFIAIATTSGTGSEVTKNAVITGKGAYFKKSIRSDFMIPNIALVDPTLTLSVPPDITAETGLDALIQNLEAYTSKNAGPITDTLARKGIELSGRYLLRAVQRSDDLEAREGLSLSSLYGGITLLNAGLGLAHALSHPLGIRFGIPHGKACALTMAKVIQYNYSARNEKYEEIGMLLGGIKDPSDAFTQLTDSLEISTKLGGYGVKEDDIPLIVEESKGGSRRYNPVDHDDATVAKLLRELL
jgi:alcohol dehydrogenase class IV